MSDLYNVECTAIPDGIHMDGSGRFARISVILRPEPRTDPLPAGIDKVTLLEWTEAVKKLDFEVSFGEDVSTLKPIAGIQPEFDPPGLSRAALDIANEKAASFWKGIWETEGLQKAFRELMTKTPKTATKVESYSYALLAEIAYERIASDVFISELSARNSIDRTGLSALARARLNNPNDPAIRINDAILLTKRDTFAGLEIGDPLSQALTRESTENRSVAVDEALDDLFSDIRSTIDRELEAGRNPKGAWPARTRTWNPFLPEPGGTKEYDPANILEDRFSDEIFGKTVGNGFRFEAASLKSSSRSTLGLEAFRRLMRSENAAKKARTLDEAEQNRKNASRHVANLQAHPALRKFVRLIIDIPVPLEKIPVGLIKRKRGVVSVKAKSKASADPDWFYSNNWIVTAFEIDEELGFFEPCPQWQWSRAEGGYSNPSVVPSLPLDKGVVQLNIGTGGKTNDSSRRFRLEAADAIAALLSHERATANMVAGIRKGFSTFEAVTDEPGMRTRGIMLLDTEAIVPAHVSEKKEEYISQIKDDPKVARLQFAEDLIDGYRVDIVAPKPIAIAANVFRQSFAAGARRLSYNVIQEAFGGTNPYTYYASRDEGFIRSPSSVVPIKKQASSEAALTVENLKVGREVLFTWTGANLGLPTAIPDELKKKRQPLQPGELKAKVTYDFSSEPGAILRTEKEYFIILRARKTNGGSVSTSFGEKQLKHAIGAAYDSGGFKFRHVERTPAPLVLVPAGQTLAKPDKEADQPSPLTMIAVPDAPEGPSVRMLVSPNVGFNIAEQQSQFDYPSPRPGVPADEATRRAAVLRAERGAYLRLKQDLEKGGFPPFSDTTVEKAQALLFEIVDPPTEKSKRPHYVDSTLWSLMNFMRPTGYSTNFDLETTTAADLAFWKQSNSGRPGRFAPEGVVPIRLEVVAREGSAKSRIVKAADLQIGAPGRMITVPVLRVEVGRADTLELELWADRLEPAARTHPALYRLKEQESDGAFGLGRVASLHEFVRFRIAHPVQLPLVKPRILSLGAVRCSAKAWTDSKGRMRDDEANAESSFAWGKVQIDRKSTGTVWAECRWIEVNPALYLRRTKEQDDPNAIEQDRRLFEHAGYAESGKLFLLNDIPPLTPKPNETEEEFLNRANTIDLARDDNANLRALAADFRSSRARKVISRLVARSRFAPPSSMPGDFTNSVTSTPDDVFEEYVENGGIRPEGTHEFWLPATRAPVIPALTRNYGIAYRRRFNEAVNLPAGHKGTILTHIYRCWLDDRWFDSGPFEKLAIICRPTATTPPDWLESLLSKWGGDMTMRSGRPLGGTGTLAAFLEPEQFVVDNHQVVDFHDQEKIPSILRNVPLLSPTGTQSHNVDVALLEPKFDSGAGLWYCDIEMKGAPAFKVDLDLSLARYQHHAITGCHLSKPVIAGGVMLHQPWSFKAARTDDRVEIAVVGPAYTERAPMTQGLSTWVPRDVTQRAGLPFLTAELERMVDGSPLPVRGTDGRPVVTTSRNAMKIDWDAPDIPAGCTRWTMVLAIPKDPIHHDQLAVRISLASTHANSSAADEDVQDGGLITLPEPMVAQLLLGE